MQAGTHFIFGIICGYFFPGITGILLAFLSHIPLDVLARSTYHPPQPLWKDPFWVWYHFLVFMIGLSLFLKFYELYFWYLIASVLVDLYDWVLIRGISFMYPNIIRYKFHSWIHDIREVYCFWLPDLTFEMSGILPEYICLVMFLVCL